MSSSVPIILPQVTVQHDFESVFDDVGQGIVESEDIWVSCYKQNETSVHGKVKVSRKKDGGEECNTVAREGITWEQVESALYAVSCPKLSISSTHVKAPRRVIGEPAQVPVQVSSFDVSPDLALCATGDPDGNIILHHLTSPAPLLKSAPHQGAVLSLRFFPSSKVILTSSSDLTLAIMSTTDLAVARRLKSRHKAGITDTAIISRGRNILSCSRDGTVRLWDVGGGEQIRSMGVDAYSAVTKLAVGQTGPEWSFIPPDGEERNPDVAPAQPDPREVETSDKLVFCALKSGIFNVLDLNSRTVIARSPSSPDMRMQPLHAIAFAGQHSLLATGSLDGVVTVYDTRQISSPLFAFRRNGACVEDLAFTDPLPHLLVATEDGLPFRVSVAPNGPEVVEELVGYVAGDAVRGIRFLGDSAWTAGDDGVVRRY